MTDGADVSIEQYRTTARAWIEENLERRPPGEAKQLKPWDLEEQSPEELARQRALQRRLHEAGYAGITWPVEYGGQGLTREHEQAFLQEAAGFFLPDLGIAGGATFGVCAPTMLAHATPGVPPPGDPEGAVGRPHRLPVLLRSRRRVRPRRGAHPGGARR